MPAAVVWEITSNSVNAEGNQLVLGVRVMGTTAELGTSSEPVSVVETGKSFDGSKVGLIACWRFDDTRSGVFIATTNGIAGGCIFELKRTQPQGTSNVTLDFKLAIGFQANARIAPGNPQGTVVIPTLASAWLTLKWQSGPSPIAAPAMSVDGQSGQLEQLLVIDAGGVGALPSNRLVLYVDAVSEWVARNLTAGVSALDFARDYSPQGNATTGVAGVGLSDQEATQYRPVFQFNGASNPARLVLENPPVITDTATIGVVFTPATDEVAAATLVGRYDEVNEDPATPGWRYFYNRTVSPKRVTYQAKSGTSVRNVHTDLESADTTDGQPILAVFRRNNNSATDYAGWINGRSAAPSGSMGTTPLNEGVGSLKIGARATSSTTWEAFKRDIAQVALYDAPLDDLKMSLVMHQMTMRAGIIPGTPIPSALQSQPYSPDNQTLPPDRQLQRRPIAVITLTSSDYDDNVFGQSKDWRDRGTGGESGQVERIKKWLWPKVREAFAGCDQFEIMFNRPAGKYDEDIVPSYVFGWSRGDMPGGAQQMILPQQWRVMRETWDQFHLADHNDDAMLNEFGNPMRRAWFYTGGGVPLNDDGSLNTHGYMSNRSVAPSQADRYQKELLDPWAAADTASNEAGDERWRCLFVDAVLPFHGKFVEMVHDGDLQDNFTLVGEAIPTDETGRLGAPWFALVTYNRAPWWNPDDDGLPDKGRGYNPEWQAPWETAPTYFGVISSTSEPSPNLSITEPEQGVPGDGSNMSMSDIYRWIRKGAVPVAWNTGYAKVGAAWDYATGRIPVSRMAKSPRIMRIARV